jgi:hypothetical protein
MVTDLLHPLCPMVQQMKQRSAVLNTRLFPPPATPLVVPRFYLHGHKLQYCARCQQVKYPKSIQGSAFHFCCMIKGEALFQKRCYSQGEDQAAAALKKAVSSPFPGRSTTHSKSGGCCSFSHHKMT